MRTDIESQQNEEEAELCSGKKKKNATYENSPYSICVMFFFNFNFRTIRMSLAFCSAKLSAHLSDLICLRAAQLCLCIYQNCCCDIYPTYLGRTRRPPVRVGGRRAPAMAWACRAAGVRAAPNDADADPRNCADGGPNRPIWGSPPPLRPRSSAAPRWSCVSPLASGFYNPYPYPYLYL